MSVYNLGTLGQEQKVNPYMENLMKFGMASALQEQELAGKERIAKAAAATEAEVSAKTFLAKTAVERQTATINNIRATWQARSDMDKSKGELFDNSDHGKEYYKFVKSNLPELFDEGGKPILFPSTKDTIKAEMDEKIGVVKNKLLTEGPNKLTPGEQSILQMEGYKDEIASVTADLYKNPEFIFLMEDPNGINKATGKTNAETAQNIVKAAITQRTALRQPVGVNDLSNALGGGSTSDLVKPGRFKVKRVQ